MGQLNAWPLECKTRSIPYVDRSLPGVLLPAIEFGLSLTGLLPAGSGAAVILTAVARVSLHRLLRRQDLGVVQSHLRLKMGG